MAGRGDRWAPRPARAPGPGAIPAVAAGAAAGRTRGRGAPADTARAGGVPTGRAGGARAVAARTGRARPEEARTRARAAAAQPVRPGAARRVAGAAGEPVWIPAVRRGKTVAASAAAPRAAWREARPAGTSCQGSAPSRRVAAVPWPRFPAGSAPCAAHGIGGAGAGGEGPMTGSPGGGSQTGARDGAAAGRRHPWDRCSGWRAGGSGRPGRAAGGWPQPNPLGRCVRGWRWWPRLGPRPASSRSHGCRATRAVCRPSWIWRRCRPIRPGLARRERSSAGQAAADGIRSRGSLTLHRREDQLGALLAGGPALPEHGERPGQADEPGQHQ